MTKKAIISDIVERLFSLCSERNIDYNTLFAKANVSQSIINVWKNDDFYPSIETLSKLCAALDISLKDFFADCGQKLAPTQEKILAEWEHLSTLERNAIFNYIAAMKACSQKNNLYPKSI